jgi:hypothetical protein
MRNIYSALDEIRRNWATVKTRAEFNSPTTDIVFPYPANGQPPLASLTSDATPNNYSFFLEIHTLGIIGIACASSLSLSSQLSAASIEDDAPRTASVAFLSRC